MTALTRQLIYSLLFTIFIFPCFVCAAPPSLAPFPTLEFQSPEPERIVLPNGLVVLLLEDHELPLIQLNMLFPGGSQNEPAEKIGLTSLMSYAWSQGGTPTQTPETIEQTLERKAASVSFSIGVENSNAQMTSRVQDFDAVFAIFTDLMLRPAFRKDRLVLARSQAQESLRRMNDDPDDITRREYRAVFYGRSHPYARVASPKTLKSIRQEDFVTWHKTWIKPNGSYLAISGDFDASVMKTKLTQIFATWTQGDIPISSLAPMPEIKESRLFYIQRPINQTQIRVGYPAFARHSSDEFAWVVFNELWGGGSTSRLFQRVRTEMGLAYAVGSAAFSPKEKGFVVAVSQTRGVKAISAAKAILDINNQIRTTSFTEKEIETAKDTILNAYIQNFTSSAQIVSAVMSNEFFGYPKDYIATYPAKIRAIRSPDVQRVATTYLLPEKATLLFVGDLSTFEKPLSTLGKPQEIRILDYTTNESFY